MRRRPSELRVEFQKTKWIIIIQNFVVHMLRYSCDRFRCIFRCPNEKIWIMVWNIQRSSRSQLISIIHHHQAGRWLRDDVVPASLFLSDPLWSRPSVSSSVRCSHFVTAESSPEKQPTQSLVLFALATAVVGVTQAYVTIDRSHYLCLCVRWSSKDIKD